MPSCRRQTGMHVFEKYFRVGNDCTIIESDVVLQSNVWEFVGS